MSSSLVLYGVPFSQPVRAVMWLMLYKQQSFEMMLINPGSSGETGSRNPTYLEKFPGGTIPSLEDKDSGFLLSEAHAIMCYLCNRFGWTDLYPDNHELRAKVDWYLHFHHRNVREASGGLVAPKIRKDLNISEEFQRSAQGNFKRALEALEEGWLRDSAYLVGDQLTIADMAAYVEIGQLQSRFTNVYDFSPYPNVSRWLDGMTKIEYHDDVHTALIELGDISVEAPAMETIVNANKKAFSVLKERLAEMES